LVVGGTIVNFLPFAMEYLARHPGDVAQLAANPQKIPQQVEKMLRHFRVVAQARLVTKDLVRDDVELKSRDMVLVPSTLYGPQRTRKS
jgi:cytochrome P450